ncbi:MAG TPA: class I SAM-dependent methyltransferase, partial [Gaiella sp.]|nr:class I SAM-dependent methyltransferase [Gaiella sp.]
MSEPPFEPVGLPDPSRKAQVVRGMFDRISTRYDLVNRVMTFGMDIGWRRRAVRELRLPGGALVADLACGTGDLCDELLTGGYRAVGFDFSHGMLRNAGTSAPLVEADALRLPLADGRVDGATCGFALRNVTEVTALFAESARVLRPGGRVAFLETSEPDGRLL